MKLDGAIITIEPRPVGGCIDLAFTFCRNYAARIYGLCLLHALPSSLIVFLGAWFSDLGMAVSCALLTLATPALGITLVAGLGPRVFGSGFDARDSLRAGWTAGWQPRFLLAPSRYSLALLLYGTFAAPELGTRLALFLLLWVPLLFILRISYLPEVIVLERQKGRAIGRRLLSLVTGGFLTLTGRALAVTLFGALIYISVFTLLDRTLYFAFGYSLLFGTMDTGFFLIAFREAFDRMLYDPFLITAMHAVFWLVYPLARIAWFFCYLDLRIRTEGWDLELDYRIEARRIGAGS